MGTSKRLPEGTPLAPHADRAAIAHNTKEVPRATSIPSLFAAAKDKTVIVIAAPVILTVAPIGIVTEYSFSLIPSRLANAKLTAFRMQLHPHFLFNSLNSVMSLIDMDKLKAKDMLVELSILMRRLLEQDNRHTVLVKDELSFIKSYLELERLRFEDRLKITYKIEDEQYSALVPNLILQPIIENAIKHGFSQSTEACEITIEIKEL